MVNRTSCQCRRLKRHGFDLSVGTIPWRRAWQPTLVSLPGESHGQRSLEGYSPWGCRVRHNWSDLARKHADKVSLDINLTLPGLPGLEFRVVWSESESCSVMSDFLWLHGLYRPWNSPGQNTGVGSLSLLQGIFLTQESNWGLLHCRWILYQLSYQGKGDWGVWKEKINLHQLHAHVGH